MNPPALKIPCLSSSLPQKKLGTENKESTGRDRTSTANLLGDEALFQAEPWMGATLQRQKMI